MRKFLFVTMLGVLCAISACTVVIDDEMPVENFVTEEVVITATHEYDANTKTVLKEDGSVWWKPGDAIGVFFGPFCSEFRAYNSVDAPSAKFIGNALIVDGHNENSNGNIGEYTYWGVFPPSLTNSYTTDAKFNYHRGNLDYEAPNRNGESVNVYLPSRQKGVAGTFDYNNFISIAKSNDYKQLSFYNLCGGLAFCVENEGISKVTFAGNDGEILAGQVNVVMDSKGHPVVNEVLNGKTEVTLAMNSGQFFVPGEWYYIVMLPTTLEKGYTMTFSGRGSGKYVSEVPVEIKRSVFGRLSRPDSNFEYGGELRLDIEIDGDFFEWDYPSTCVSVATCAVNAPWTALKTLKAYADYTNLYIYFEFDKDEIQDRSYVPFHVYINQDNNTEGCGDDLWLGQGGQDFLLEGAVIAEDAFCPYDPALIQYFGTDLSTVEWAWEIVIPEGSGIATGVGSGNAYELSISLASLDEADVQLSDLFAIGVEIQQSWNPVGVLPNAAITDDNPRGAAPMLEVRMY